MDALRRESRGDDREQVGAMHGQMRRAVKLLAARVERRPLQRPAILPAPLMRAGWPYRLAVERVAQAEPIEYPRRVRTHVDAAADFGELRRLLVDVDVEPAWRSATPAVRPPIPAPMTAICWVSGWIAHVSRIRARRT
jgi:hypothetical protein